VGEYHFARGEFWPAIDAYGHATNYPDAPFYDKALYKLAWSWYRLADKSHPDAWENSARTFGRLLDAAPDSSLRGEALQYLALIYADHGGLAAVRTATDGKSWGPEVFPALAEVWFEEGAWKDASEAFRLALDQHPDADAAPAWMNRRVLCAVRLNWASEATDLREKLHFRYGTGSRWAAEHAAKPATVSSAASLAEPALLQAAVARHQQAQMTGLEADYAKAAELYGEYLLRYPGRPAAYDITFYRAECLYYARHFADAADAYGDVLQYTTDDRWHAEAAFSRVKAREKLLGFFPALNVDPVPETAAAPMQADARAYATAADDMVCVAPTDWRLPEVLFRASEVYYASRRLSAARSRAEAVVTAAPKEDFAAHAAMLVVDAWRLEGNWAQVETNALRFGALDLGRTDALRDSTHKAFARIALDAGFRVAIELDAKGDYDAAARKFLAVADGNPKSELAPRALFGAADSLEKAGKGRLAGETFGRVYRQYPSSPLAMPSMFRHARAHERILLVGQATAAYEDYLKKYPGGPDARAAAWNVAVLLEAAGRDVDAAQAWERFSQKFPGEDDTITAQMRAGDAWARAGKAEKSLKTWRALIAATTFDGAKNVIARAGLARAERAAGVSSDTDTRTALEAQAVLLAHGQSSPESARAAARVGLAKAADLRKTFDEVKITLPEAKLKSGMRVKRDVLAQLEETLLSVAAAGDADAATEALYRIGDAYAAYARAVREAPLPKRPKDELDAWKEQMAATAEPVQEKAAAAFRRELDLAKTAGISTDWTRKSRAALALLDPSTRDPREDSIPFPAADVWALPERVAIPGTQLADAGAAVPAANAREIAEAVDAFARARDKGDRGGAVSALKRIDETLPLAGKDPALVAAASLDAALAHAAMDDDAGAATILEKALSVSPDDAKLVAAYVAEVAQKGDPDIAINAANGWLSKHPADGAVRANLAGAQMLLGKFAAALDTEVDALSADTRQFAARRGAMSCAAALRRPELAVYIARQAIEDEPDNPRAVEALGIALRHSGDERVFGRAAGREMLLAGTVRFPNDSRLAHAAGAALLQDGDVK
ncbi:MAG TPA: tetratricopeptide repeat protein, partial [bacterium]|nr:tetratricopeptide repeat protein [bacterium]